MGWQNVVAEIFEAGDTTVINSSGLFVYSGTPALGNLIVSIATSAGSDTYGNSYPKGINVTTGIISGTAISGGTITGAEIVADGTNGNFLAYSGTPALGNLIGSISPSAGTDSFGNTYLEGVASYSITDDVINIINEYLNLGPLSDATLRGYLAYGGAGISTLNSPQVTDLDNRIGVGLYSVAAGKSGNSIGQIVIGVPAGSLDAPTPDTTATVEIQGTLAIVDNSADNITSCDTAGVPTVSPSGDSNTYKYGRKTYVNTTITVSSVTPGPALAITGLGTTDNYRISGKAVYHRGTAAGNPAFGWTTAGGAVVSNANGYEGFLSNGAYHTNDGSLGSASGPTFSGAEESYVFDVDVTLSTGGTIQVTAAEGVSGDSWIIDYISAVIEPY
jgi:hypothetical protein